MDTDPSLKTMILLVLFFPIMQGFATLWKVGQKLGFFEQAVWLIATPVVWIMTIVLSPFLGMYVVKKSIEAYCAARN